MKDKVSEPGWPADCPQRAFCEGAAWWQFHANGATMFSAERDEAETEAVRRYGVPLRGTGGTMQELYGLLSDLVDRELCSFDHEGHCQSHNWSHEMECPHSRGVRLLNKAWRKGEVR